MAAEVSVYPTVTPCPDAVAIRGEVKLRNEGVDVTVVPLAWRG